ncbi:MAG: type ISP restriction/modification enzyme, partial [Candidatus Sulfotelmatobacter sp.]
MDEIDEGIVGIITNHNYLDGPTFRGMRQSLMATFNCIYVLDLHGSIQRIEDVPDGINDQNVFDIRPGVAIALFIKNSGMPNFVRHADLWGRRHDKYLRLAQSSISDLKWADIRPSSPYYFFRLGATREDVKGGKSLDRIFRIGTTALQTSRDEFALAFTESDIRTRLRDLGNTDKPDSDFRSLLKLKKESQLPAGDSTFWNLTSAREELRARSSAEIAPLMYRPFDVRYLIYDEAVVHRMKREVSDEMRHENLSLLVPRQLSSVHFRHAFVTTFVSEMCVISSATKEQNRVFPLWHYDKGGGRQENLSPDFRTYLDERYDHHYTPEEILGFIYSVLYAPSYRTRYAEFLRIDFPRVPFPESANDFEKLSKLGWALVQAHLLRELPRKKLADYHGNGDNTVEATRYSPQEEAIWINKNQFFKPVPQAVWDFHIGGYQVLDKYLKSRKGRILSLDEINHVAAIANSLAFTIEQMAKIDEAYQS